MKKTKGSYILSILVILALAAAGFGLVFTLGVVLGEWNTDFLFKSSTGNLVINITPAGSKVTLDGKSAGQTPARLRLKPGKHKLVVEKETYYSFESSFQIKAGETLQIDHRLMVQPAVKRINENARFPGWAANGDLLFLADGLGVIQSFPPAAASAAAALDGVVQSIVYAPDGKYAVVNILRGETPELLLVNLAGGDPVTIGSGSCPSDWRVQAEITTLCWSASDLSETAPPQLLRGSSAGSFAPLAQVDLARVLPARQIGVSGNGKWLSILTGQTLTLWAVSPGKVEFAHTLSQVSAFAWDPNSPARLVYLDQANLFSAVNAGPSLDVKPLAENGGSPFFWAQDQTHIYYAVYNPTEGGSSLWSLNVDNGSTVLAADANLMRGRAAAMALSPDGHTVAYTTNLNLLYTITFEP
jgi:hypothetical protein